MKEGEEVKGKICGVSNKAFSFLFFYNLQVSCESAINELFFPFVGYFCGFHLMVFLQNAKYFLLNVHLETTYLAKIKKILLKVWYIKQFDP